MIVSTAVCSSTSASHPAFRYDSLSVFVSDILFCKIHDNRSNLDKLGSATHSLSNPCTSSEGAASPRGTPATPGCAPASQRPTWSVRPATNPPATHCAATPTECPRCCRPRVWTTTRRLPLSRCSSRRDSAQAPCSTRTLMARIRSSTRGCMIECRRGVRVL